MANRLTRTDASSGLRCSFCGRAPEEGVLVTAPEVAICETCVARSADLLDADDRDETDDQVAADNAGTASVRARLIGEAEVASLISIDDVIEAMKAALPRFSAGEVVQPVRTVVAIDGGRGFLAVMPAQLLEPPALGAKLVSMFPGNAELGLPTHTATVVLLNPRTGVLTTVMDGRLITELRTAAVSALSTALLAREETAVLAIVGSGVQARSHLEALERVWTFSEVRVWSPTPEHLSDFLEVMEPRATAPLLATSSAQEAVRGADVVVLATSSTEPVVESAWIGDGAHVISVGACRPDQREMDPALVARSRLYVDSREAAVIESGDVVLGIAEHRFTASHIVGEIGDLIAGRVEGRRSPGEVTVFKSLGLAVEDVATAELVYERAVQHDVGAEHEF